MEKDGAKVKKFKEKALILRLNRKFDKMND